MMPSYHYQISHLECYMPMCVNTKLNINEITKLWITLKRNFTQVRKYDLDSVLIKATLDRIIPVLTEDESKVKFFKATLHTGENVEAKTVIMATGPSRAQMANIPCWVRAIQEDYPEESLQHTVQLMHYFCTHEEMDEPSSGGFLNVIKT